MGIQPMSWLSSPLAIVAGAAIIALSIVGSSLLTPYQVSSSPAGVWRINTITGDMQLCNIGLPGSRCM